MAANPALAQSQEGQHQFLCPAPFQGEVIALRRDGVEFWIDGVRTRAGTWTTPGALFLTNLRLVFVAREADPHSGLTAFDLPLGYLHKERFNQPVFACNNLAGLVWRAGGPQGAATGDRSQPPHSFKISFRTGGVGTCIPLFFHLLEQFRGSRSQAQAAARLPPSADTVNAHLHTAFVDPADPSSLFLASPVSEASRLKEPASYYAADYGTTQHEAYEPTELQPGPPGAQWPPPAAV